jgi:hypothetical protein
MLASARTNEKTDAAIALGGWRNELYVAWTGTDLALNLALSPDGCGLVGKQRLGQRSYRTETSTSTSSSGSRSSSTTTIALPPSLVGAGEQVYLAWTSPYGALNLLVGQPPGRFTTFAVKQRSVESPALTTSERGSPMLAWTGTDRHVNLLSLTKNRSGKPVWLDSAKSHCPPAACSHRGSLMVAWTGTDRRINLLSLTGNSSAAPIWLEEAKSSHAPAVCSHRGGLILAWTGTDRRINVLSLTGSAPGTPARLEEAKSSHAPALYSHRGGLILAWAGTDSRINLGRLE